MGRIKNLIPLGMFFSMLPPSEIRDMLFEHGILPTYIRGIGTSVICDNIVMQFRLSKGSDTKEFRAVWNPKAGEVTYRYGKPSNSRRSRTSQRLDGMRWKIDFLSNLQMGWEMPISRAYGRPNRNVLLHLEDFVASFDP